MKTAQKGRLGQRRKRTWRVDGEQFRELRLSCFLSRKATAEFLGCSLRTVRYWDAGRYRVPWSVVRLLRLYRLGDLGALDPTFADFRLVRGRVHTPEGLQFTAHDLKAWWWDRQRLLRYDRQRGLQR